MTENEASVFKQTAMRIGLLDRLSSPLSEQEFLAMAEQYVTEQVFYGNRTYWHGSHTPKIDRENPSIIDKVNPKGGYEETYFSVHFGYALTYALRLDDFSLFSSVATGKDLTGSGHQIAPLDDRAKRLVLKSMEEKPSNWWMIPFKIKPDTRLFHANDISDLRVLYASMQSSKNPKTYNFVRQTNSLEHFFELMKPLAKIDWFAGIPENYPFNREELLTEIRNRFVNGHSYWDGYVNCEKGNYSSIGLFNEHLERLLVGPLYQVKLVGDALEIARYGHSVNASIPPNTLPNKP